MYARIKLFTISLHTFEIPDIVRFQSPENRFSFSEPARPLYFTNIRRFRFRFLYFKYLQTLILCVTTFYKTAFYYNVFRRRLRSRNIKMFKVSYILHYECVLFPKFNKLSNFFPVVWFVTIL